MFSQLNYKAIEDHLKTNIEHISKWEDDLHYSKTSPSEHLYLMNNLFIWTLRGTTERFLLEMHLSFMNTPIYWTIWLSPKMFTLEKFYCISSCRDRYVQQNNNKK